MSAPHEKPPDQQRLLALLADESQLPVEDVAKLYEQEHAALAVGAPITKFLHIFAIRNVQEILRQRGLARLAVPAASRPPLAAQRPQMPLRPGWSAAPAVADKSSLP